MERLFGNCNGVFLYVFLFTYTVYVNVYFPGAFAFLRKQKLFILFRDMNLSSGGYVIDTRRIDISFHFRDILLPV